MANNLRKFNNGAAYSAATLVKPAVSLIADTDAVYFDPKEVVPPTPFEGKWLATYTGGTTESAACDASSAITEYTIESEGLVSLEIGDCVTEIGEDCIYGTETFTSLIIGSGVTSIGISAFADCPELTSITIKATTPPTLDDEESGVFGGSDCPIYVPSASVDAYKSASSWSNYISRIQAIS